MLGRKPYIFRAKVMHKRLIPKINQFNYRVYYLVMPISDLDNPQWQQQIPNNLKINRLGITSFFSKDHGKKDGSSLKLWITDILKQYNLNNNVKNIALIAMPRIFGYVFNPVSFWLCLDGNNNLIAVLSEVNNTFGETHCYLCYHHDFRTINSDDIMVTNKLFHVSPFLERNGEYKFRFTITKNNQIAIYIDYYNENGKKQLLTSLMGKLEPLTKSSLRKAFWQHPLVTFKTIFLIHMQALKLVSKKIKYINKPPQKEQRFSVNKKDSY